MKLSEEVEGLGDQEGAGPCAVTRGTLRQLVQAARGHPRIAARVAEGAQSFSEKVSTTPAICIASLPAVR